MSREKKAQSVWIYVVSIVVTVLLHGDGATQETESQAKPVSERVVLVEDKRGGTDWTPVLIGGLGIAVGVCGMVLQYLASVEKLRSDERMKATELRHSSAWDVGKIALEFKMRQLNELYTPLLLKTTQSKKLYERLTKGKPEGWHFLTSVKEVKGVDKDAQSFQAVVDTNLEIEKLLYEKSGLIVTDPATGREPKSYTDFLRHFKIVKAAWAEEIEQAAELSDTYPQDFDKDVAAAHDSLRRQVGVVFDRYERILDVIEQG